MSHWARPPNLGHFVYAYTPGFNDLWGGGDLRAEHNHTAEYGDGTGPVTVKLL